LQEQRLKQLIEERSAEVKAGTTWDDCVKPHCQKDPDHVTHPLHIEIMEQDLSRLIPEGCGSRI
jgi:hypothetical protein